MPAHLPGLGLRLENCRKQADQSCIRGLQVYRDQDQAVWNQESGFLALEPKGAAWLEEQREIR